MWNFLRKKLICIRNLAMHTGLELSIFLPLIPRLLKSVFIQSTYIYKLFYCTNTAFYTLYFIKATILNITEHNKFYYFIYYKVLQENCGDKYFVVPY